MTKSFSILKKCFYVLCKIYNKFYIKHKNSILFIPHHNCLNDHYDIINFHSDNVLCLLNYILKVECYQKFIISLVIDDFNKVDEYYQYCKDINPIVNISFIPRNTHDYRYIKAICKSKYIFTTTVYELFPYKIKSQKIYCLGYFTPFKNDFVFKSDKEFKEVLTRNNLSYDIYFSTSDWASRIISSDSGLYYSKFLPFGMPRNDIFFDKGTNDDYRISELRKKYKEFDGIILYTPTFRDYEENDESRRNIFGCDDKYLDNLVNILQTYNYLLIIKLHPYQNSDIINKINVKNIQLYDNNQSTYSLYDLLFISDILITDYTSTYFDFLLTNRNVIFYFYDKEEYERSRGFAFNPIEECCAGDIAYTFTDLLKSLTKVINGQDDFKNKRIHINNLYNKYSDGLSSSRIAQYVFSTKN